MPRRARHRPGHGAHCPVGSATAPVDTWLLPADAWLDQTARLLFAIRARSPEIYRGFACNRNSRLTSIHLLRTSARPSSADARSPLLLCRSARRRRGSPRPGTGAARSSFGEDGRRSRTNRRFDPAGGLDGSCASSPACEITASACSIAPTSWRKRSASCGVHRKGCSEDPAGVNDRFQPGASLAGATHRIQELQELGFVAYACKLVVRPVPAANVAKRRRSPGRTYRSP